MSPVNIPEQDLKALDEEFEVRESESGEAIFVTHPEGYRKKYSKCGCEPSKVLLDAQDFLESLN